MILGAYGKSELHDLGQGRGGREYVKTFASGLELV